MVRHGIRVSTWTTRGAANNQRMSIKAPDAITNRIMGKDMRGAQEEQ